MSFSNWKYDACYMSQQSACNASIFRYVTDSSMYMNRNACSNFTPPFLSYVPSGIPEKNVEIENDLKGINRPISHCDNFKFNPQHAPHYDIPQQKECPPELKIVSGYTPKI